MTSKIDHIQSEVFGPLVFDSADSLKGRCEISGSAIIIMIQAEIENSTLEQWLKLIAKCERIFMNLSEDTISNFRGIMGAQVTEATYEPIGQEVREDAKSLSDDLDLKKIILFDGGGCLYWRSPKYVPDMELSLQFDLNYEVEDIMVW